MTTLAAKAGEASPVEAQARQVVEVPPATRAKAEAAGKAGRVPKAARPAPPAKQVLAASRSAAAAAPEYGAIAGPDILAGIPEEWELPDVRLIRRTTDPEGNVTVELTNRDDAAVAIVDALGKFTRYQYGAFGSLRRITSPAGRDITFDHDAYGRTRSVNDPSRGLETAHYNGLDDVIRTTDALNRERELFYDDFGRVERIDDVDGSTHYAYDGHGPNEIGRLVEATSPTGNTTRYSYEPPTTTRNRGLLTGVTESAYPLGTDNPIERTLTTRYHFDDAGRLSQVDYPKSESGGVSVRYHFDDFGHVVKVAHAQNASNVFWELLESEEGYRIGTERVGNAPCGSALGTTTTRTYKPGTDALSGITTTCGASTLQNLSYGYDEAGNLTSRNDTVASQNRVYRYDALNRLTHVNGIETYTYDPERGRLTSRAGTGSYSYRAEPTPASPRDWLDNVGGPSGTTYEHDAVGNVTERSGTGVPGGRQAFTYTAFDLPKVIESGPIGSGTATRFAYGASGSRLAKQTEGPTPHVTFYASDLYQRTEPSISATPQAAQHRSVIYAGGRAVAQLMSRENADGTLVAPSVRYLYDDVLGSVQTITDASGALVGTRDYEAFGKHAGELSSEVILGFTGHEEDTELGLVNMKGRIYDPVVGQFLQTDPIMAEPYSQGLNRYAYVNNSPLNYIDPTGMRADERDQLGIGVSAFGAGVIGGTGCAAYCGSIAGWLGSGGGAALASAGSAGLSAWNLMSPRVSHSGTSTAPQQSRSAPASGHGVPSRGRAAVSDVAPVREGPPQNKGGVGPDDVGWDDGHAEELGASRGNYLGQPRPPRRGPRGAPMPGARNSPVLRPERTNPIPLRLPIEILRDKLVPGGRPVGEPGNAPDIRWVHTLRDPLNTAFQYFQFLTENGTIGTRVPPGRYPGAGVVLPGGNGFIGIRPYSTTGPPTIDIHIPGVPIREIKFLPLF